MFCTPTSVNPMACYFTLISGMMRRKRKTISMLIKRTISQRDITSWEDGSLLWHMHTEIKQDVANNLPKLIDWCAFTSPSFFLDYKQIKTTDGLSVALSIWQTHQVLLVFNFEMEYMLYWFMSNLLLRITKSVGNICRDLYNLRRNTHIRSVMTIKSGEYTARLNVY